jgi:hypothetical protein
MRPWRLALLVVPLATCSAGNALADRTSELGIKNPDDHEVTVEYRIGNYRECDKNREYVGRQTIGPKQRFVVKIRDENTCCLRVAGQTKWIVSPLAAGRDYEITVR